MLTGMARPDPGSGHSAFGHNRFRSGAAALSPTFVGYRLWLRLPCVNFGVGDSC